MRGVCLATGGSLERTEGGGLGGVIVCVDRHLGSLGHGDRALATGSLGWNRLPRCAPRIRATFKTKEVMITLRVGLDDTR